MAFASEKLREGERWVDCGQARAAFDRAKVEKKSLRKILVQHLNSDSQLHRILYGRGAAKNPELYARIQLHNIETFAKICGANLQSLLVEGVGLSLPKTQDPREFAKAASRFAFQGRVDAFFEEYLHSDGAPIPFGGRDSELSILDGWLAEKSGPARFLITAPSGRGKSALLVRWLEGLRTNNNEGWAPVFVPISIRFGLNAPEAYLQAIAERLASILESKERLEKPAFDSAAFYADKIREMLLRLAFEGKNVLLVVDGIDEALSGRFDASIFPKVLPPSIRIVVSARLQSGDIDANGWVRRLGWDLGVQVATPLELEPLGEGAIADILVQLGAPFDIAAKDADVVKRLSELSEGEPLLLRYYAEDLWREHRTASRVTRKDLETLKPGFGAYFERWLELQEHSWRQAHEDVNHQEIDAVLALLAFAHGPLDAGDLLDLRQMLLQTTPLLSTQMLLSPLRRFVIGDGRPSHGYILSHPKIGAYLQEERFRAKAAEIRSCYANWGKQLVSSLNAAPAYASKHSVYALQFLARHFEEANVSASDFMSLAEDGWRRAWFDYEGGERGFASNVRSAWNYLKKDGHLSHLGWQIRCALALSSIKSLGMYMPRELVAAAVSAGVLSVRQGHHLAELMQEDAEIALTLADLALQSLSNPTLHNVLLHAALQRATSAGLSDLSRAEMLRKQVDLFLDSKTEVKKSRSTLVISTFLAEARTFRDARPQTQVVAALAPHLPPALLGEALAVARAIADKGRRSKTLAALAPYLPPPLLGEALAAARAIQDENERSETLAELAPHLPPAEWEAVSGEALAAARAIQNEEHRSKTLAALAPDLPPALLKEALAAACAIKNEEYRSETLTALAPDLPPALLGKALAAACAIKDEEYRSKTLAALAPDLPPALLKEALAAARAIKDEEYRSKTLTALAQHRRPALLGKALTAVRAFRRVAGRRPRHRAGMEAQQYPRRAGPAAARLTGSALEETLDTIPLLDRATALIQLRALLRLVAEQGGIAALRESRRAINDTSLWYP